MDSLYREIIIDHWKNPRNFGRLQKPDSFYEQENPLCGDRIRIELKSQIPNSKFQMVRQTHHPNHPEQSRGTNSNVQNSKQQTVKEVKFSGEGCAISIASASMLTEKVKGRGIEDLKRLTKDDIVKMLGIELTPIRLKCALLPLEVLQKAIR